MDDLAFFLFLFEIAGGYVHIKEKKNEVKVKVDNISHKAIKSYLKVLLCWTDLLVS